MPRLPSQLNALSFIAPIRTAAIFFALFVGSASCSSKPVLTKLPLEHGLVQAWAIHRNFANRPVTVELPIDGLAICLSGGGYRATLFSLGAMAALHDMGVLRHATVVGGVSGGAITAAQLVSAWSEVEQAFAESVGLLDTRLAKSILDLTNETMDIPAVVKGMLLPMTRAPELVAQRLDKHLFNQLPVGAILSPDRPRLMILATSLNGQGAINLAAPFQLHPPFDFYDQRHIRLAEAVATSAAFPPFLAPYRWRHDDGSPDHEFADGGIIDNIGISACIGSAKMILIDARSVTESQFGTRHATWLSTLFSVGNTMHLAQQNAALIARAVALRGEESRSLDDLLDELTGRPQHLDRSDYYISLHPTQPAWMLRDDVPADAVGRLTRRALLEDLAGSRMITLNPYDVEQFNNWHNLCVSVATRFKGLDNETRNGLLQWGYMSAWAAIDGRLVARGNAVFDQVLARPDSGVRSDSEIVAEIDAEIDVLQHRQRLLRSKILEQWVETSNRRSRVQEFKLDIAQLTNVRYRDTIKLEADAFVSAAFNIWPTVITEEDVELRRLERRLMELGLLRAEHDGRGLMPFGNVILVDERYRVPFRDQPSCLYR